MLPEAPSLPAQLAVQLILLQQSREISNCPLRKGRLDSQHTRELLTRLQQLCGCNSQGPVSAFELYSEQKAHGSCLIGKAAPKGQHSDAHVPGWLQHLQTCRQAGRVAVGFHVPELSDDKLTVMRLRDCNRYSECCNDEQMILLRTKGRTPKAVLSKLPVHVLICHLWHTPLSEVHDQSCHYFCDDKDCMNPKHLCWGSNKDNAYHREWHKDNRRLKNLFPDDKQRWPDQHAPPSWKKRKANRVKTQFFESSRWGSRVMCSDVVKRVASSSA